LEWSRRSLTDEDVKKATTTVSDDGNIDADELVAQLLDNADWPIMSNDVGQAGVNFGHSPRTMYNAALRYAKKHGFRIRRLPKDGAWWMHKRALREGGK
jgi:hypothetical protein